MNRAIPRYSAPFRAIRNIITQTRAEKKPIMTTGNIPKVALITGITGQDDAYLWPPEDNRLILHRVEEIGAKPRGNM